MAWQYAGAGGRHTVQTSDVSGADHRGAHFTDRYAGSLCLRSGTGEVETDHEAAEAQAEQAESSEGLQEVLLAKRVGRTCQVHCQDRFDIIYMLRLSQG